MRLALCHAKALGSIPAVYFLLVSRQVSMVPSCVRVLLVNYGLSRLKISSSVFTNAKSPKTRRLLNAWGYTDKLTLH